MKVLVCLLAVVAGALAKATPPDARIYGGHDAERNEYPFQASVQYCPSATTCQHACGGVIISDTAVLTAGHCITNAPTLGSYRVLAGILNLTDDNPEREFITVSYAVVHPDYKGGINPDDLAIFKLAEPLIFNEGVRPADLPPLDYHVTGDAVVIGWGSIGGPETPIFPNTLQVAPTVIINATACRTALDTILGGAPHPFNDDTNICTINSRVSICTGDSGGPLIYRRLIDDANEVIGISSWGITPCGTIGAPSVYVKVHPYLDWIRMHMFN